MATTKDNPKRSAARSAVVKLPVSDAHKPVFRSPRAPGPRNFGVQVLPHEPAYDIEAQQSNLKPMELEDGQVRHCTAIDCRTRHLHLFVGVKKAGAERRHAEELNRPRGPRKYLPCIAVKCTEPSHFHPKQALKFVAELNTQEDVGDRELAQADSIAEWEDDGDLVAVDSLGNTIVPESPSTPPTQPIEPPPNAVERTPMTQVVNASPNAIVRTPMTQVVNASPSRSASPIVVEMDQPTPVQANRDEYTALLAAHKRKNTNPATDPAMLAVIVKEDVLVLPQEKVKQPLSDKYEALECKLTAQYSSANTVKSVENMYSRLTVTMASVQIPLTMGNLHKARATLRKVMAKDSLFADTPAEAYDVMEQSMALRARNSLEIQKALEYTNLGWLQWRFWQKPFALVCTAVRHYVDAQLHTRPSAPSPWYHIEQRFRKDVCFRHLLPEGHVSPLALVNDNLCLGSIQDDRDRPISTSFNGVVRRLTAVGGDHCRVGKFPVGFTTSELVLPRTCNCNLLVAVRERQLLPVTSTPEFRRMIYSLGFTAFNAQTEFFFNSDQTDETMFNVYCAHQVPSLQKILRREYAEACSGQETSGVAKPFVKGENAMSAGMLGKAPRNISAFQDLLESVQTAGPIRYFQKQLGKHLASKQDCDGKASGPQYIYTPAITGDLLSKIVSTYEDERQDCGESDSSRSDGRSQSEGLLCQISYYNATGMSSDTTSLMARYVDYRAKSAHGVMYSCSNEKSGKGDTSLGTTLRHLALAAATSVITAVLDNWGYHPPTEFGIYPSCRAIICGTDVHDEARRHLTLGHEFPWGDYPATPEGALQMLTEHPDLWGAAIVWSKETDHQLLMQNGDDSIYLGAPLNVAAHQLVGRASGMKFEDFDHGSDTDAYDKLTFCSARFADVGSTRLLVPKVFRILAKTFMPTNKQLSIKLIHSHVLAVAIGLRHLAFLPVLRHVLPSILRLAEHGVTPLAHTHASQVYSCVSKHYTAATQIDVSALDAWFARVYGLDADTFCYLEAIDFSKTGRIYFELPGFEEGGTVDEVYSDEIMLAGSCASSSWCARHDDTDAPGLD